MKHPLLWLLAAAVIAFGICGFIFLGTAASTSALVPKDARTPALISGILCLVFSVGLLMFGVASFRKRD